MHGTLEKLETESSFFKLSFSFPSGEMYNSLLNLFNQYEGAHAISVIENKTLIIRLTWELKI